MQRQETSRLTAAQRAALEVIVEMHPKPVGAHKRSTTRTPIPRVNVRAANELSRRGLARTQIPDIRFWSPYSCDYKFTATDAGREMIGGSDAA